MKKYKLIKEYPNSPLEGTVVTKDELGQYVAENPLLIFQKVDIEMYPEFWEEIKEEGFTIKKMIELDKKHAPHLMKEEPNYLITAFRELNIGTKFANAIITLDKDGTFQGTFHLNELLHGPTSVEDGSFEIYSVKNKYGIEFTIRDTVNYHVNDKKGIPFKIHNFFINRDEILLARSSSESTATCEDINTIYKFKPIYTTTDGTDIEEGDDINLFIAAKDLTIPQINTVNTYWFRNSDKEVADRYLTFTSIESRDKYIKEHTRKPIFTSADGKEFYSGDTDYSLFSVLPKANWQENRYRLNDCIKFPKKEWLHFHTKEARQEYIDNNKPKYSLNDIEKAYSNTLSPIQSPLFNSFKSNLINLGK